MKTSMLNLSTGGELCKHCVHCTPMAGNVPTQRIHILPPLSPWCKGHSGSSGLWTKPSIKWGASFQLEILSHALHYRFMSCMAWNPWQCHTLNRTSIISMFGHLEKLASIQEWRSTSPITSLATNKKQWGELLRSSSPCHQFTWFHLSVNSAETSKLGWVHGETFFDMYAPALPKQCMYYLDLCCNQVWMQLWCRQSWVHMGSRHMKLMTLCGAMSMFLNSSWT